jgi:protein subunit release factor A
VEARCQDERSQVWNRVQAWNDLCAKLWSRKNAAAAAIKHEKQLNRRRTRQKSYGQKVKMIQGKKHRAKIKSTRQKPSDW